MSVIIYERHQSRTFTIDAKTASLTRDYAVTGSTDETEVYELVIVTTPRLYDTLVRKSVKADHQGGGIWFATVEYTSDIDEQEAVDSADPNSPTEPGPDDPLGPSFSFDTSGQTIHIGQSKGTRSKTDVANVTTLGNAGNDYTLDNKRAIGLTRDKIEGVDVHSPGFQFQIEVQRANCSDAYLLRMSALTGTVNYGATFRNRPAGSVLYLGASGRFTQKDRWTITHKFAYSPNQLNIRISDTIVIPAKKGWDYIWVGYEPVVVGNQLLNKPNAAYVEYVYDTGYFADLEIGA